ncbi:MAG: GMC family oxidoreductase N-terminal domain-containing protein [Sphingomonadales bacterium]|nr:GMC family oxidoreductase N-terminal domain-containing protein [Sphingomonadales bacterium]
MVFVRRSSRLPGTSVKAAGAAGIPEGDYNGSGRHNLGGVASPVQTNTRHGKRLSTFHAYLENNAELRPNLTIITRPCAKASYLRAKATA